MADRELRIKMSLDNDDPKRKLTDFEQAAEKTTGRARDAMGRFSKSSSDAGEAVKSMGSRVRDAGQEVAGLIKAQLGMSAVRTVMQAIGDDWRRISEEIGKASKEFQAFRQSLQGTASLSGNRNTNAFAASEIAGAEKAHVTVEEFRDMRQAFLSKASTYIGNGKDARMSDSDAAAFQQSLAEYAKSKGISQGDMGEFAGGLLAQSKGKMTLAQAKAQASRVLAGLEASSTDVKQLLPQTTRAMAQGLSPEEAAALLAQAPEYAPGEESTHVLRAMSAMRQMALKGHGDAIGFKKGASVYSNLRTMLETIQKRRAAGEDLDAILQGIAPEEVAQRAIRGMLDKGGAKGLDRWKGLVQATADSAMDDTIKAERRTESGLQRAVDSAQSVEHARLGMRNDRIERRRQIADIELMKGGGFERRATWSEMAAAAIPGNDDVMGIRRNLQMIRRARAELHESSGIGDANAATNRGSTDELMRQLLARLDKQNALTQEQNDMMKRDQAHANPVPPALPARPPNQAVRVP